MALPKRLFADRIIASIERTGSILVAGIDPRLEQLPEIFFDPSCPRDPAGDWLYRSLTDYSLAVLETLAPLVAAFKPNAAFFEQYGIQGLRALSTLCKTAQQARLPLILDAKRGDIGSTASAYARAYLDPEFAGLGAISDFPADALTVNPFLGLDSLEPFLTEAQYHGRGLFILTRTSNPGSRDFQHASVNSSGKTVSEALADWINEHSKELQSTDKISGLGAVVAAIDPYDAQSLRHRMPDALFLVPGFGAQGGTLTDAIAAARSNLPSAAGLLINSSRSLTLSFADQTIATEAFHLLLKERAQTVNEEIGKSLSAR